MLSIHRGWRVFALSAVGGTAIGAVALTACSSGGSGSSSGAKGPSALVCQSSSATAPFTAGAAGGTPSSASPPGGHAPAGCRSLTGFGASETSIGFASDGTVFLAPASVAAGNGVARSRDNGASWEALVPEFPDGGGHTRLEPFMYVDPADDHVYFATSKLVLQNIATFVDTPGIHLTVSADQGDTWAYHDMAPESRDWVKIFSGGSAMGSTPHTVYFSAPSPIAGNWAGIFPPPDKQYVYKSLDGGQTWQTAGTLPLDPSMVQDCSANDYIMFGDGAIGPDGAVYLGYRLCTHLAVAASHDGGATWTTFEVTGAQLPPYNASSPLSILGNENAITGEPITVDASGNLYAVWEDPTSTPRYASSADSGKTWSAPVVVLAPPFTSARFAAVAAKAPGTIAIAYLGSADGTKFDGVIEESTDALDATPTFWAASISDPSDPLYPSGFASGYDVSYFSNGGDGVEFVQVKYAPSGDAWGSFVKDMCTAATSGCSWDYAAHANSRFQGAAGVLKHGQ
jgi:hypothetical protein